MGLFSGLSWDNLSAIFRAYTIAILIISPIKTIINYPYYKLGIISNPLPSEFQQTSVNYSFLLDNATNVSYSEICLYAQDIVTKDPTVKNFLEKQCGLSQNLIASAQSYTIASSFLGTLLILAQMIPNMIITTLLLPYVVYSELEPLVKANELAFYGLVSFTAIWMVIHVIGLTSAILSRLR